MKKFFNEFKEFALRGNVMNLAVGIIIGAAFQNIVTSLINNILSPFIGLFTGENLDALCFGILGVTIQYGAFITSIINFIIMALVIFLLMKIMNKLMALGKKETIVAEPRKCPFCMTEIHNEATRCPACTSPLEL